MQRYQGRLSGPLIDRIDLAVTLPRVRFASLREPREGDETPAVAARVAAARASALARQGCSNALLPPARLQALIASRDPAFALLERAAERLRLSARACHRVLRVARTIADLDARDAVSRDDVAEALSLRVSLGAAAAAS